MKRKVQKDNKVDSIQPDPDIRVSVIDNVGETQSIYVDCMLFNDSYTEGKRASFDQTVNIPLINNISDYKLGIITINCKLYADFFNLSNYYYAVILEYPPDSITETVVLPSTDTKIYTVEQFLEYTNTALATAWNNVITAYNAIHGGGSWQGNVLLPQIAPGIVFDHTAQLFTMYADYRCVETNANKVNISMSIDLYSNFIGLNFVDNITSNRLIFTNGYQNTNLVTLNSNQMVKSTQDTPAVGLWSNISALVITSNKMEARKEPMLISTYDNSSSSLVNNILTTFPINKTGLLQRYIEFNEPTVYWVDLLGDKPLNNVQFELSYLTFNGDINPVYIGPRSSIFVRLCLAKHFFSD